jgi:predicted extracellular nuclease
MRFARHAGQARLVLICACLVILGAPNLLQADARGTQRIRPIHDIQGTAAESSFVGQTVLVQAVVTGDYQGNLQLGGFFIQEEAGGEDADERTSEGIFVYCDPDGIYRFNNNEEDQPRPGLCTDSADIADVATGDLVEVEGVVEETYGQTQINVSAGRVSVLSQGNPLPVCLTNENANI